jgi:hypothetical protein
MVQDSLILAVILAVFAYLSKFYLSQVIDDTLDVTIMSEFPRLVANHFTTNAWFYPFTVPLQSAFDLMILPSLLGNVLHPFLGDWVLTQRAVAVAFVFATALSMYYVSFRLFGDRAGALFAAVAYGYSNEFIMRMPSHLSLLGGFVFPILLYTLKTKRYVLSGLTMGLAFWSSPEFGLMSLILALTFLIYEILEEKSSLKELLYHYSVTGLVFVAMTVFLIPTTTAASEGIANDPLNLLWRGQFALLFPGPTLAPQFWEQTTPYLGLTVLVTAAVVLIGKRNRFNYYLLSVSLVFVALSMVFIPYWPFSDMRIPSRFAIVAIFALSLLAGQLFTLRPFQRTRFKVLLLLILMITLVADTAVAPPNWYFSAPPFQWNDPGYQLIRSDPNATAQIDFPVMPSGSGLIYYQYEGVLTGKNVVDGQTSGLASVQPLDDMIWNVPFLRNFLVWNTTNKWLLSYRPDAFKNPPRSSDLFLLKGWGIDYIVLHKMIYSNITGTEQALNYLAGTQKMGWITEVYEDPYIVIYKITI